MQAWISETYLQAATSIGHNPSLSQSAMLSTLGRTQLSLNSQSASNASSAFFSEALNAALSCSVELLCFLDALIFSHLLLCSSSCMQSSIKAWLLAPAKELSHQYS